MFKRVEIFSGLVYINKDGSVAKNGSITDIVRWLEPIEVEGRWYYNSKKEALRLLAEREGLDSSQIHIDDSYFKKDFEKLKQKQRKVVNAVFNEFYKDHKDTVNSLMKMARCGYGFYQEEREKIKDSIDKFVEILEVKVQTVLMQKYISTSGIEELLNGYIVGFDPTRERLELERKKVDIGCPVCRTRLVYVKTDRYETLDEHVCSSERVSEKDVFGCPNKKCDAHKLDLEWLCDGSGPYSSDYFTKDPGYIDGNCRPFRTMWRGIDAQKEKTIWEWPTNLFTLCLRRSCHADNNGKVKPFSKYYHFQLFIAQKNGGKVLYHSGIHMFIFSMRSYFLLKDRSHEFKNHISRLKSWDKRWWSKLSFAIAKVLYRKDYEKTLAN